jgi:sugar lactone lactonase YvrE
VMASATPTATPMPTQAPFVPVQTVTPIIRTWQEWTSLASFAAPEAKPTNVIRVEDTLWVSVSSGRLYSLDLQGEIVDEMNIPAACIGHWAWDGESLWASRRNTVHRCDPNTWEELSAFETDLDSIYGITWDGESVWVIDSDGNLRSYDPTGQRLRRFAVSVGGSGWPISMLWVEEELWIVRVHGTVLRYESVGFEEIGSFDLTQCGVAWAPSDVAASWDGENLWVADTDNNRILQCAPGE